MLQHELASSEDKTVTVDESGMESQYPPSSRGSSWILRLYGRPWTQILLISFICFCLPGMYNALTGLGGSGQVDSTVAANATVALLATTAVTALFFAGPLFSWAGPRACFLAGGWTYALYSGSLLNFNHASNGAFVIAAGSLLGIGSALVWVVQGAIMTTYVPEAQRGRAIAVFWVIFNLGGGIGSLASFGINYDSSNGSVSSSTYAALMAIMIFGWALGLFICSPSRVGRRGPEHRRLSQGLVAEPVPRDTTRTKLKASCTAAASVLCRWRVLCMLPLFFSANVFYSYQQNNVNGQTFNIRTRSLNGALYWLAQMLGGLFIGLVLDMPCLSLRGRARLAWLVVFLVGMAVWGGGYRFQLWQNHRLARGLHQDIDFKEGAIATGPIMLYIFYGSHDALWQGFAYWLIGSESDSSAAQAAILVGAYKALQACGGCMAWRINALEVSPMRQLAMNWALCIGSLIVVLPTVLSVTESAIEKEDSGQNVQADEKRVDAAKT
ncbi:hypothetical protein CDD82_3717 [Ophiocordyceps australis]|uniref:Major facilitator superfamily (MFS) profile domain-containing protein n=1 Tax=Ophiocordyceps australis TaxID=1399860 RepID=A0A2C5Y5A5_9HYPO|nr:hypothetical protein CDD82_3717 [Ophiocordyceps australis]